ncbi:predicted protein [Botrytis cinerea T4]|uniref:Uncharacterized protein n=1 Tax=Botryotinia fuckeliana (strain T4) TaxID=999810 RepID=G2YWN2_BOTF4|nr:predicted protein [Botrytis cinerea T4]
MKVDVYSPSAQKKTKLSFSGTCIQLLSCLLQIDHMQLPGTCDHFCLLSITINGKAVE